MVGRGALGNPWVFRAIGSGSHCAPTLADRFAVVRRHFALYVDFAGEWVAAREMRKHLCWYLRGLPGSAMVRAGLQTLHSAQALEDTLGAFERALSNGQAVASERDFNPNAEGNDGVV